MRYLARCAVWARDIASFLLASAGATTTFTRVLSLGHGLSAALLAVVTGGLVGAVLFTVVNDGPRALVRVFSRP